MSHQYGKIIIEGKTVAFYEYDGTADIALSALYNTLDEMSEHWRSGAQNECTCSQPATPAFIWSSYGGRNGFYWQGTVCLLCKALIGPCDPCSDEVGELLDAWYDKDGVAKKESHSRPSETATSATWRW